MPEAASSAKSPRPKVRSSEAYITQFQVAVSELGPALGPRDALTVAKTLTDVARVLVKSVATDPKMLKTALSAFKKTLAGRVSVGEPVAPRPVKPAARPVERSSGAGLGAILTTEVGDARLEVLRDKGPIEGWAGPVAGAGEIQATLAISRSTLHQWHARNAVVGLLRGERKRVYPLEQFIDGRPLEGVSDVVAVAPDQRSAWLWLRQPHPALGATTPLDLLKAGKREDVRRAAERDFV